MAVHDHTAHRATTAGVRGVVRPGLVALAALGGVALLGVVDPSEAGHYPGCPFLAVTGLYCPGCGTLRAVHALAHADLGSALQRNPFAVAVIPFLVWAWVRWLAVATGRRTRPTRLAPGWALHALLAAVLLFWALRNLPGWTWLSPA